MRQHEAHNQRIVFIGQLRAGLFLYIALELSIVTMYPIQN